MPPWASINDESGKITGLFVALVKELSQRTSYDINITLAPFSRVDKELESGRQDCTMLVANADRSKFIVKGEMIFMHNIGIVARKGIKLNSYHDLNTIKVSVIRGLLFSHQFDNDNRIQKEFNTDYMIGLRKMSRQRIDAVAGAIETIRYLAKKEGLLNHLGDDLTLSALPILLQCSKKSAHLSSMKKLNKAIKAMRADGTIMNIKKEYYQ